MKKSMMPISLLIAAVLLLAMAAGCVAPTPATVVETVVVEKEVEKEVVVTVEVEKEAEMEEAAPNPYRPDDLFQAVEDLKAATADTP